MIVLPLQVRAARNLLNWSQRDLCKAADVSEKTLIDFEKEQRTPYESTVERIARALERAGVEFIEENGGGPGVRLRKRGRRKP